MDISETIGLLLVRSPDDPLCDACLAFATAVSLPEARAAIDRLLLSTTDYGRTERTCASCRRLTRSIVYVGQSSATGAEVDKCVRCSHRIWPDDEAVRQPHGDLYHQECWRLTSARERIDESRRLNGRAQDIIRRARDARRGGP
jgi:hypothetical protein